MGTLLATGTMAPEASADGLVHVKDVKVEAPADGTAEVRIVTTGTPQFTARVADAGRRLIVDIDGADVAGAPGAITRGNAIVGGVMTQAVQQSGLPLTRVVVNLARPAEYRISAEPGALRVSLVAAEKTAPFRPEARRIQRRAGGGGQRPLRPPGRASIASSSTSPGHAEYAESGSRGGGA